VTLLLERLEDFIGEDNPVRVIDVFVDGFNLVEPGFERIQAAATGRPGYHPAMLLKLYIPGYLNHVHSSRRLQCEGILRLPQQDTGRNRRG
jgi:transposase